MTEERRPYLWEILTPAELSAAEADALRIQRESERRQQKTALPAPVIVDISVSTPASSDYVPLPPYPEKGDKEGWESWWAIYRESSKDPHLADGL
jgi:hypothetical protein